MNDLGQLARLATPTLRRRLQITSNRHFIRICENAQFWVGALDGFDVAHPGPAVTEDGVALARHVAADGTVLVHNAGALPLDASAVTSVAVIGHNARYARSQGGGSATVIPERVVSPLEGIRAVLPGGGGGHLFGGRRGAGRRRRTAIGSNQQSGNRRSRRAGPVPAQGQGAVRRGPAGHRTRLVRRRLSHFGLRHSGVEHPIRSGNLGSDRSGVRRRRYGPDLRRWSVA